MKNVLRLAAALIALAASLGAGATSQRTFVASNGSDSNACSLVAPCRSFATAIAHTNDGGEVIVLDSAGYGAVTITQSVSIIAPPGVYAGISVFSGDGVTIASSSAVVLLHGLSINGQGGNTGIVVSSAANAHIENTTVGNMQLAGIFVDSIDAFVAVKDTVVRGNGGHGIYVATGSVSLANVKSDQNQGSGFYLQGGNASIGSSTFNQNVGSGIRLDGGGNVTVSTSAIARNQSDCVFVNETTVSLDDCAIDGNLNAGVEVTSTTSASAWISGARIANNGFSGAASGVRSISNNTAITLYRTMFANNVGFDVDATNCCTYSLGDNAWGTQTGANISVVPHK